MIRKLSASLMALALAGCSSEAHLAWVITEMLACPWTTLTPFSICQPCRVLKRAQRNRGTTTERRCAALTISEAQRALGALPQSACVLEAMAAKKHGRGPSTSPRRKSLALRVVGGDGGATSGCWSP